MYVTLHCLFCTCTLHVETTQWEHLLPCVMCMHPARGDHPVGSSTPVCSVHAPCTWRPPSGIIYPRVLCTCTLHAETTQWGHLFPCASRMSLYYTQSETSVLWIPRWKWSIAGGSSPQPLCRTVFRCLPWSSSKWQRHIYLIDTFQLHNTYWHQIAVVNMLR